MFILFEKEKEMPFLKLIGVFDNLEIANEIIIKKENCEYPYAELEKNKIKIDEYKYISLI